MAAVVTGETFKDKSLEKRKSILNRIVEQHPEKVPVLIYPTEKSTLPLLPNEK